jgi:hypothetical protein
VADEFNIAQDIKVEISIPTGSNAVWNLSKWDDGSDWASASSFTWTDIVATVSQAQVTIGSSVQDGFYTPAEPNTLTIQMQSQVFDPSNNPKIRPNTPIRVTYRPLPDSFPAVYQTLFTGFIDTFEVSYDTFGNNLIDIMATSSLKRLLAKNISSFVVSSALSDTDYFDQWATAVGATIGGSGANGSRMAGETFEEVGAGELLDNLLQIENGLFYQDAIDDSLYLTGSLAMRTLGAPIGSFSNVHSAAADHYCISDVVVDYDMDTMFNTYIIDSTDSGGGPGPGPGGGAIGTSINQDMVDLYGPIRCEKTLHLRKTDIVNWLALITPKDPGRKVLQVTTPSIKRDGKLANLFGPQNTVQVELVQPTFTIDEEIWVTKVIHTIDPNNWFTTLELWKGF